MSSKLKLADSLMDEGFIEMERTQHGKRKTTSASRNPIIARADYANKRPAPKSRQSLLSAKKQPGREKLAHETSSREYLQERGMDETSSWEEDHESFVQWHEGDTRTPSIEPQNTQHRQHSIAPMPSFKPEIFDRLPNVKTSDGKVGSSFSVES
jgi:hypothetical protein